MKIACETKKLCDAVNVLMGAVSAKSTLAAMEGILFVPTQNTVKLVANNLEIGMRTEISAKVEESDGIILNAKLLSSILKKLPGNEVNISTDDKLLTTIASGSTEFTIMGIAASEFPELPEIKDSTAVNLPQGILASMIRQTIYCISTDESKPVHTGSKFELSDGQIRIVSVDGFRLAIRTEKVENKVSIEFVIPGNTLNEILKLLTQEKESTVRISVSKKHGLIELNGYTLITRLLEGDFLDYQSVLLNNTSTEIEVKTKYFIDCVDRASLVINDRLKSPVVCNFDDDVMKISVTTNAGRVHDKLPIKKTGDSLIMGFNNSYLLDALKAADCDKVKLLLTGPLSPMKICPADGSDNFLFLVLPVRLPSGK